jgi:hypothetical protein
VRKGIASELCLRVRRVRNCGDVRRRGVNQVAGAMLAQLQFLMQAISADVGGADS